MEPQSDLRFDRLAEFLESDTHEFFERTWEKSPALFRRRTPLSRASFVRADWRDLARQIWGLPDGTVEVIKGGRPQKPEAESAIDHEFANGASVRIFKVQRAWPFLETLLRDLEFETGFRLGANVYVTPTEQQGLGYHSDSHDVFVVQMAGAKHWEIFDAPFSLPVEFRAPLVFEEGSRRDHRGDAFGGRGYSLEQAGQVRFELTTEPGDLLYIPRGFVHRAFTSSGVSAHVTIGCHAMTWGDLLALAAAQEARREPALRETLPPGALRRALPRELVERELRTRGAGFFEHLHGEGLMLETAARFGAANALATAGPMSKAAAEPGARENAPSAVRLSPTAYVSFGDQAVEVRSLRAPSRVQAFPVSFRPVFESLVRGESAPVDDFPAVTPRGRSVLASRLLQAGIVERADANPAG